MPRNACSTSPVSMSWSAIAVAVDRDGEPDPGVVAAAEKMAVLMPMISPAPVDERPAGVARG
jgi:hypothetical protein